VKICGVTRVADAEAVAAAGADYLGLNLWQGSKRCVSLADAAVLAQAARAAAPGGGVEIVALFVDAGVDDVITAATALAPAVIQLHGDESPETCAVIAEATGVAVWKAVPVSAPADVDDLARWPVAAVVLDAPSTGRGGSGARFDWSLARRAVDHRRAHIVLAGGLTPETVGAAVAQVEPWAVDVASGVETSPGIKDHAAIHAFVAAARAG
jgi:phosphoribosylanthranilate isomerase